MDPILLGALTLLNVDLHELNRGYGPCSKVPGAMARRPTRGWSATRISRPSLCANAGCWGETAEMPAAVIQQQTGNDAGIKKAA